MPDGVCLKHLLAMKPLVEAELRAQMRQLDALRGAAMRTIRLLDAEETADVDWQDLRNDLIDALNVWMPTVLDTPPAAVVGTQET